MERSDVYKAIDSERGYQDRKWPNHKHEVGSFLTIMRGLMSEAETAYLNTSGDGEALRKMLQVVAVGVACMEQHGQGNKRHPSESTARPGATR